MSDHHPPQLWLLTGGNGSGKSTFYARYLEPKQVPFVNADRIARELWPDNPESHSYNASTLARDYRQQLLTKQQTFCFETVYSHPEKVDFVAQAKALGYQIIVFYIYLNHHQANLARVATRVIDGGHDVPEQKVIERIPRTLDNIKRTIPLADELYLLDNSSTEKPFQHIAKFSQGVLHEDIRSLPPWAQSLAK